jgi:tetratricopeptide (TPR) repeat protein
MDNTKLDFFVSYTACDEAWARWIVPVLEENGYSCFCQYKDIKAGQNFLLEMDKAIKNCERVISVLSQAYLKSFYADEEWTGFLAQKRYANIIPVRIEDFKPEGLWATRVYIDIAGKEKKDAEPILLKELEHLKKAPPTEEITHTPSLPETVKISPNFPKHNSYFTGRDAELYKIHRTLNKNNSLAITGMGGIGKSQIAIEYVYRYAAEYQYIWWVNAETHAGIDEAYLSFAQENKLVLPEDREKMIDTVKDCMRKNGRWLFIFDNAEDEKTLERYCPALCREGQHILVTSRNTRFRDYEPMNVRVFTEEKACEFIEKYTGKPADEYFKKLAIKMDYLPLALDQAGAYIKNNEISYKEYFDLYEKYNLELLSEHDDDPNKKTVATTWQISFEKINNQASKQLLNLCAFFASDNIYKEWFQRASEVLPEELHDLREAVANGLQYNKAISELKKYSLVSLEEKTLSIHRLVQDVIRDSLKQEQTEWRNHCIKILNKLRYSDFSTVESRELFSILSTHIDSVTNGISDEDAKEEVAQLYHFLGWGFDELADYPQALIWYKKALDILEKVLGKKHPDTASIYSNIGLVYHAQGNYNSALGYHKKALVILKKGLDKENSNTVAIYNNMGLTYRVQGNYDSALKNYRKALDIQEKVLGEEQHPVTAITYGSIGQVYQAQGNFDNALKYNKKALDIFENVLGKHPNTAIVYDNIGQIYNSHCNYDSALKYFEKALDIFENVLGKHPDTATTYNNIGYVYCSQGNFDSALEYFGKALDIYKKVLGNEHPFTANTYDNIAEVYKAQGKSDR